MRILDALDRYQLHLRSCGRSPHTLGQATRHIKLLAVWLADNHRNQDIEFMDHEELAHFLISDAARLRPDGAPKKATSLNGLRSSLRAFFSFTAAAGLAPRDPSRLVRRAHCAPPPPRALTDDERERLLNALDAAATEVEARDQVLFRLLLCTGIRIGSAIALHVGDINLANGEIHLRAAKGDARGRVFIPAGLVPLLRAYLGDRTAGPLFLGRRGRMTTRHAQRRFAAWLARAGISRTASPHSMRHTFATRLLARTGDLRLVQQALGHRSIASTTTYARNDENRLRSAFA